MLVYGTQEDRIICFTSVGDFTLPNRFRWANMRIGLGDREQAISAVFWSVTPKTCGMGPLFDDIDNGKCILSLEISLPVGQ